MMKNMTKLILRDVETSIDNLCILLEHGHSEDADTVNESIVKCLDVVVQSMIKLCKDDNYDCCMQVIERQLMFYENAMYFVTTTEEIEIIYKSIVEICEEYKIL